MNRCKRFFGGLLLMAAIVMAGCKTGNDAPKAPVSLTWELGQANVEPSFYENSFILKNNSDKPLGKEWSIYFSQLPRRVKQVGNPTVKVEAVSGNFFKMYPTDEFEPLAPGDTMRIVFRCTNPINRNSQAPEGTYWVPSADGSTGTPLAVDLTVVPIAHPEKIYGYPKAAQVYQRNEALANEQPLRAEDILPSVKQAEPAEGEVVIEGSVAVNADPAFASEAALLKEKLQENYGLTIADQASVTVSLSPLAAQGVNEEYYELTVAENQVKIAAATPHGIFNGTQTLLSMLKGAKAPYRLAGVTIKDYPDLAYRGMMMDISRDFITSENLKKLVDQLASYKMNRLHFHFSDDEGWRLEIPGLEELTEVGGRRGHTVDESACIYPGYDGSFDPNTFSLGTGFYTRKEFIELLQYAAKRHVRVIPEIESPGHARAAVVAMKARYQKYAATDEAKATEYLLSEAADTSRYSSVQSYHDNVINPALPSTYHFLDKVITEIQAMYKEAGVPLTTIHVGGDEVPHGVWVGSPACQKLMAEQKMEKVHDLSEYFITRLTSILKEHGLKMSGWQEVAQGHSDEGHKALRPQTEGVYIWSTNGKKAELVYKTANNGYPVILCNVGNFYMDLAYSYHPDERGLNWGGCVDESISFSMMPYSIYRSRRVDAVGRPIDLTNAGKDMTLLTAEGARNIVGVQGQLFSETIRSYEWVEYYIFPKILGLVERGWNAHTPWESLKGADEQRVFDEALTRYYDKISRKEMPYWAAKGINFRLPHPGLKLEEGVLSGNSPIRGAEIRYTLDGSEPTASSPLLSSPVTNCQAKEVHAALFYQGKQSLPITLKVAE